MSSARRAISAFICLNLAAVFFMNRRPEVTRLVDGEIQGTLSPAAAEKLDTLSSFLQGYARTVGLDTRWEMFNQTAQYDWWYLFTAQYADGNRVLLPLPLQSERSPLEAGFFDFRELKMRLNITGDEERMAAYVGYLCRTFAEHDGAAIRSITVAVKYQKLRDRSEALRTGTHLEGREEREVVEQVPCD